MGPTASAAQGRTPWQKFVRRARVPLGFAVAAVFLVFAHPSLRSLLWSLPLVIPGLWLRGYAAGYVKKNAELTRTGPYAHTRNPLYLGSIGIAFGVAVAAGRWWLVALLVGMFLLIYVPTILSEEQFLRGAFPGFDEYARRVPRLLPRLTPARFDDLSGPPGRFSRSGTSITASTMPLWARWRFTPRWFSACGCFAADPDRYIPRIRRR